MSDSGRQLAVPEQGRKHLARNIPLDFSAYCDEVANRRIRAGNRGDRRGRFVRTRERKHLVELCLETEADDVLADAITARLFDISVIYEALQISVDHMISSREFSVHIKKIIHSLRVAKRKLSDDVRDKIVRDLQGMQDVEEVDVSAEAFEGAYSLAQKAMITTQFVVQSLSRLEAMAEHFDYKSSLYGGGTPAKYAFEYAIHALGALFEEHNSANSKVSVYTKTPEQASDAHHVTDYDSPFLRFVRMFFQIFDNDQIIGRSGQGFGDAVRKSAKRYNKAPEVHLLLHGDSSAQHVIDFMIGIDEIK